MGICIRKTLNTKIKLTCRVFFTKKTVPVQPVLNSGSFFQYSKAQPPKIFAKIEKTKIEARLKNESEMSTLAPRDFYNKIINPEMVDSTFTKKSSIMSKRRASNILPIPRRVEEFIIW